MDNDRRKLIIGSASLPLILTVRPALGHARTSLSCREKDERKDKPYKILNDHEDEWMRKKVDVYRLAKWDDKDKKWKTLENRKFIGGTDGVTYWELDHNNPYSGQAWATSMRRGNDIKETKLEQRHALAYMGDDDMRGYGWEPKGGKHCSRSCWMSMKPKHD
ncbi:MAG: hypothetical protein ACREKH_17860 [Candidatus Rokuibacteriota bacterium]